MRKINGNGYILLVTLLSFFINVAFATVYYCPQTITCSGHDWSTCSTSDPNFTVTPNSGIPVVQGIHHLTTVQGASPSCLYYDAIVSKYSLGIFAAIKGSTMISADINLKPNQWNSNTLLCGSYGSNPINPKACPLTDQYPSK